MLAGFLLRQKRPDEALGVLEQFVPVAERSLHPASPDLALYRRDYGAALIRVKRYEDSERNLLRAYEGLSAARGARHPWTIIAARNLASLYEATGNTAEAERFRSIAAEAPK
jgi:tetratricopeptide (TPR) repeat protein